MNQQINLQRVHKVLDYGGGDGRLMQAFQNAGKECYLVDYNQSCIPGVTKLADKIQEVEQTFDLIICSHVLEHHNRWMSLSVDPLCVQKVTCLSRFLWRYGERHRCDASL